MNKLFKRFSNRKPEVSNDEIASWKLPKEATVNKAMREIEAVLNKHKINTAILMLGFAGGSSNQTRGYEDILQQVVLAAIKDDKLFLRILLGAVTILDRTIKT